MVETVLQTVKVRLLGKEFAIKTPLQEEQVRRVESYVADRLNHFSVGTGSGDTLLVASLTLMHLADECLALSAQLESESDLQNRIERIVVQLDKII
jgi:cell division protein ZapA (FtsZ GTPase activity inhibitor)